jgi:hypothetical protein
MTQPAFDPDDFMGKSNDTPSVGEDKLLQRLYDVHGDRRYEELKIREGKTVTVGRVWGMPAR